MGKKIFTILRSTNLSTKTIAKCIYLIIKKRMLEIDIDVLSPGFCLKLWFIATYFLYGYWPSTFNLAAYIHGTDAFIPYCRANKEWQWRHVLFIKLSGT